jgi:hypothetical protein
MPGKKDARSYEIYKVIHLNKTKEIMQIQIQQIRFKQGSAVPSAPCQWYAHTLVGVDAIGGIRENSIPERPCCFRVISV